MRRLLILNFAVGLCSFGSVFCSAKKTEVLNELPAPYNLQAVVLKKSISLSWQWNRPDELPAFKEMAFEIRRGDGKVFTSKKTAYSDENLAPGKYTYTVRIGARAKDQGKSLYYVSDPSEPVEGIVRLLCTRQPMITLQVEPTQKVITSIPSLRFHLKGTAATEPGCTLAMVRYHLDTGTGIVHEGPLTVDAKGKFDTFVAALGPEDEIPSGRASFAVTATAENEVGTSTSDVYTLDIELRNPYAPR